MIHQSYGSLQGGLIPAFNGVALYVYRTGGGVIKTGDKLHQRTFAAAGAADNANGLPGHGGERDMA